MAAPGPWLSLNLCGYCPQLAKAERCIRLVKHAGLAGVEFESRRSAKLGDNRTPVADGGRPLPAI
jgi:hypothetical protein